MKIWIKEKHHKRPTQFTIKSEVNVADLLEVLITNEDFTSHWINSKPRDLNVILNGQSLQHDVTMATLQATVTANQCLVVEQDDTCKYSFNLRANNFYFVLLVQEKLAEYNIKPSAIHDASTITKG